METLAGYVSNRTTKGAANAYDRNFPIYHSSRLTIPNRSYAQNIPDESELNWQYPIHITVESLFVIKECAPPLILTALVSKP